MSFHVSNRLARMPYPTGCLPKALRAVALELGASGIDPAIIGTALVGFASTATQGVADILWPNGKPCPVGLPVMIPAPSGAGKSLTLGTAVRPFAAAEKELIEQAGPDLPRPAFFIEDATPQGTNFHLYQWRVASICTAEGAQLGRLFSKGLPVLAKHFDGDPVHLARATKGLRVIRDQRLTAVIMMQPSAFGELKSALGLDKVGIGTVNRFLVAEGTEISYGASSHLARLSESSEQAYADRVKDLLSRTAKNIWQKRTLPMLRLSEAAAAYLVDLTKAAQGWAATVNQPLLFEYLARHVERTLRLAGAFHVFEHGPVGVIELDTLMAADELARWSLTEFERLTYSPPTPPQCELDAQALERALWQLATATGQMRFKRSLLKRMAPNLGQTGGRFEQALAKLGERGRALVIPIAGADWIQLTPHPITHQYR